MERESTERKRKRGEKVEAVRRRSKGKAELAPPPPPPPPPTEEEVDEFFIILRRVRVAVKYFANRSSDSESGANGLKEDASAFDAAAAAGKRVDNFALDLNVVP
ncbi:hypothetical protein ABFS82_04G138500 [Erythranthe guttata]|uniref:Uncharacterized protein n=1 Tax=Erythranthe guttata TaxID=4155 RepID=A0A022PXJ7_ERYGU|nr:PREDICTED: uncharacterized protein LOC105976278 [Erythranthe guttata]EYU21082.1 hypothetical protein MIMGU_mgv1a016877mg [Erythranthe guttata]|eukprot:XP_012857011.1 PREDICTED: uncharacterized protein LOC105976278 [Erythranthe guttata]